MNDPTREELLEWLEDAYPYDEELDSLTRSDFAQRLRETTGLDRITFFKSPEERLTQYEFYQNAHRNNGNAQVSESIQRSQAEREEQQLRGFVSRALRGKLGKAAKKLAEEFLPAEPRTGKRPLPLDVMRGLRRRVDEMRHGPAVPGEQDGL